MLNGYTLPYESIKSRAKLIRLPPKREQRSKSVGRNIWTQLWTGNSPTCSRSESSSNGWSKSSAAVIQDINQRQSNNSHKSSHFNQSHRTSSSCNLPSEGNEGISHTELCLHDSKWKSQFPKTKTTVTVYLNKTKSTPDLTNNSHFIEEDRRVPRSRTKLRESPTHFNKPRTEKSKSIPVDTFRDASKIKEIPKPVSRFPQKKKPPLELNSLQVFRQPKYRERIKSEQKIQQFEHLNQNSMCKKVVDQLGKEMQPQKYENQNSLNLVNFINQDGFITSSRKRLPITPTPQISTEKADDNLCSDHIYSEINEENLKSVSDKIIERPFFRKRVTFSSFHEPILQSGLPYRDKKILPAYFRGIVQVTQPLRSRTDDERRRTAYLCYHAIATNAKDGSHKFLGKVDNSRWGECVYMVLDESHFEIWDGDGLIIVKHQFSDISVITQIKGDPCLFVYVGRCKFNGRVGVTIRFNKSKHLPLVLSSFTKKQ